MGSRRYRFEPTFKSRADAEVGIESRRGTRIEIIGNLIVANILSPTGSIMGGTTTVSGAFGGLGGKFFISGSI